MTSHKPPEPNKTLLGLPNELQAVLKSLDQRPVADGATRIDPPAGATSERTPGAQPQQAASRSPRSVPPPLPGSPGLRPPPLPGQRSVPPQATGPQQPGSLDRTLIGMPADMQAVLQQALAQQTPPRATGPAAPVVAVRANASQPLLGQPVRSVGAPPAASPSNPAVFAPPIAASAPPGLGQQDAAGFRQAPAVQSSQPIQVSTPRAAEPWPPQPSAAPAAPPAPAVHAHAEPAKLTQDAPAYPAVLPAAPAPYDRGPLDSQAARSAAPSPEPASAMQATRLASFETGLLKAAPKDGPTATVAADSAAPRLALSQESTRSKPAPAPVKRWPAVSLLVLAILAFGGVIAARAPQLLPGPLAAVLAGHGDNTAEQPETALDPQRAGGLADPQPMAADPGAQPAPVVTDVAAAIDPSTAAAAPAAPAPTAAPAIPRSPVAAAPSSGAAAQLEKEAIERLMANDYPAAKQLYQRLRAQAPTRAEYAVMLDLLDRASAAPCGQPGQAPCATP